MDHLRIIGFISVTLAFLFYSLGSISLIRFKQLTVAALFFMSTGLCFETIGIISLIFLEDSYNDFFHFYYHIPPFFFYVVMIINVGWCWRIYFIKGLNTKLKKTHTYHLKITWVLWSAYYLFGTFNVLWISQ